MVFVLLVFVLLVAQKPAYFFAIFIASGLYQIGDAGAELGRPRGVALPFRAIGSAPS